MNGWNSCALIGSNSLFDASARAAFAVRAKQIGLTITTQQQFVSGVCTPGSLDNQMAALKQSRSRIFGLLSIIGDGRCVAAAASAAGLMGPGYFWFTTWSLMDPSAWLDANGVVLPVFYQLFQNMVGVLPLFNDSNPVVSKFISDFQNRPLAPAFWTAAGTKPSIVSMLTYDATVAMARAWNATIEGLNLDVVARPWNAFESLRNVSFEGLTGSYSFDSIQNRHMPFLILQIQNGQFVQLGRVELDYTVNMFADKSILWVGGIKPLESDLPTLVGTGQSALTIAIVIACVGCAFVAAIGALLWSRRAQPIVKASSPLFMAVILLGCALGFIALPLLSMDVENSSSHDAASAACRAYPFVLSSGFVLIFAAMLSKSYRIFVIFTSQTINRVAITDMQVALRLAVLFAIDFLINVVWVGADPLTAVSVAVDALTVQPACRSDNLAGYLAASLAYKAILMIATCYVCYEIREAPAEFNEAKQV
jgi:hypothetical protein